MNILLTGANGFVGSHLLNRLINLNHDIIITKRLNSDLSKINKNKSSFKIYNIEEYSLQEIFSENHFDAIIHCATNYDNNGTNALHTVKTNLIFSLEILTLAIEYKVKIFLNTDSFFSNHYINYEYNNLYSFTKHEFVVVAKKLTQFSNISFINLKLEHVFGLHDNKNKFVTSILNKIISNEKNIQLTKGEQKRDFVYIEDVTDCFLHILTQNHKHGFVEYNVGTGHALSIKEFVLLCNKYFNFNSEELNFDFGALDYRENEIMFSKANIDSLLHIGWTPRNNVEDGLKKMAEYYIKNNTI